MAEHVNEAGEFQSDKYPTCPPGKVPLSVKDKTAQDLLWEYARRRRAVDAGFAGDLEACLRAAGYEPPAGGPLDDEALVAAFFGADDGDAADLGESLKKRLRAVAEAAREAMLWGGPVAASDEELGAFYRDHWESVAGPIGAIRAGFQLGVMRSRAERDAAAARAEKAEACVKLAVGHNRLVNAERDALALARAAVDLWRANGAGTGEAFREAMRALGGALGGCPAPEPNDAAARAVASIEAMQAEPLPPHCSKLSDPEGDRAPACAECEDMREALEDLAAEARSVANNYGCDVHVGGDYNDFGHALDRAEKKLAGGGKGGAGG